MNKIDFAIVDDHAIFRKGLRILLKELPNAGNIDEAADGREFLDILPGIKPDIVFMDIKMPGPDGIETTRKALEKMPSLRVLALSMHDDKQYLESMIKAGAKGFLLKNAGFEEIEKAVENVMQGNSYFSVELLNMLAGRIASQANGEYTINEKLTSRETEVLELICKGLTNHEIGQKLFISQRTVEKYRANLLEKTGSKNTVSLVIFAIKNKLVSI